MATSFNLLEQGKVSVLCDGQFGSSGKGSFAGFVAQYCPPDIATSNAAPNAGHTAIIGGKTIITKHLPITGVLCGIPIYLNAGARINPDLLMEECAKYGVDRSLITIHPRAAVITPKCIAEEQENTSTYAKIASTQSGVGAAAARKITRHPEAVAEHCTKLTDNFNVARMDLNAEAEKGKIILAEVPQGYGLGINEGLAYPYCTSHSITVPQALADANVHPKNFGQTLMCLRTYPIRVGNLLDKSGNEIGVSGPFYPDSKEITWKELGQKAETTTNTGRIRRVATFSFEQYKEVTQQALPDTIFLNFANYCDDAELDTLIQKMFKIYKPAHLFLGFGPKVTDIQYYEGI